jgi:N-acetylglutamate synthase-like GNAT family acetyltransferase
LARGKGWGTKLLNEYAKYAKSKGVKTIYACSFRTRLNKNTNFWLKNGFKEMSKAKSFYWKTQLPDEKMDLVCYAKNL